MTLLRSLLLRSPGVTALAAMAALSALVWVAPVIGAHTAGAAQARPFG